VKGRQDSIESLGNQVLQAVRDAAQHHTDELTAHPKHEVTTH